MNDGDHTRGRLWQELFDLERRYDAAKAALSADEVFALWSALWRFSEKALADHRRLKTVERKRRQRR